MGRDQPRTVAHGPSVRRAVSLNCQEFFGRALAGARCLECFEIAFSGWTFGSYGGRSSGSIQPALAPCRVAHQAVAASRQAVPDDQQGKREVSLRTS